MDKTQSPQSPLQHSWFAHAEQVPHQQAQVPSGRVDLVAFVVLLHAAKLGPSGSSRLAAASESLFKQFAADTLQLFALVMFHAAAVVEVGGLPLRRFFHPV